MYFHFMNQKDFETPMTAEGDIDFDKVGEQLGMTKEDYDSRAREDADQADEDRQNLMEEEEPVETEPTEMFSGKPLQEGEEAGDTEDLIKYKKSLGDSGTKEPDSELDDTDDEGDDDEPDVDDDAEDLGKAAATGGEDEEIGDGLETGGALLDATGWGAIIGVPMEVAGAVL